jgi:hypothetical protein
MLPNIRLLIVAVLAAIAGISCGLGLFATFRVNHEPLVRFSEGGPPLQLAFNNRTAAPEAASPIAARLPVDSAGKTISAPVLIPPPAVEESQAGAGAIAPQPDSDAAGSADAAGEATIASATPADTSERAAQGNDPIQSEAEAAAASEPKTVDLASNSAVASAANEPAAEKDVRSAADDPQTPAKPPIGQEAVKTPVKTARAAVPVRRAAKVIRRRAPTTVAAQPADQFAQANYQQSAQTAYQAYQWTDPNAQARQTVRRVVVKRHRAVKKPAPPAQSSLAGATAGVGGPQ